MIGILNFHRHIQHTERANFKHKKSLRIIKETELGILPSIVSSEVLLSNSQSNKVSIKLMY